MSSTKTDIAQLNSFLRGEIAAVETYQQCINKIDSPVVIQQLKSLQMSHQTRVNLLSARISNLGGEPADKAGLWGNVAKLVEASAGMIGESTAVSALEEGEDHGLKDYRKDIFNLSPELQVFVQEQLIAEQQRTHDILSSIDSRM